jgi:formate/nitrite transporter
MAGADEGNRKSEPDGRLPGGPNETRLDALLPREIAEKAETVGAAKARLDLVTLLALAVLAGAFIALGAMFSTTILSGANGAAPPGNSWGIARFVAGLGFSVGLILVVIGGAELFTGNTLMVMALASRRIRIGEMLRAWAIVYLGNLVGAVGTALLVFLAGQYLYNGGDVGRVALGIARAKAELPFGQALFLGILCNVLVCLALWLSLAARTVTDKVMAIMLPIAAFVAAGFEHSVANMYFIPLAEMIVHGAPETFWSMTGLAPADYAAVGFPGLLHNLIPVTIGNIIGGGVLVGLVYWFVYLRRRR